MKKIGKKLIAMICICSMLVSFPMVRATAGEETELKTVTFAEMGIANNTYSYNNGDLTASGQYNGSLLNTKLTQKITFSNHAGNWLHYAGSSEYPGWCGIRFNTMADGKIQIASANGEFEGEYFIDPTAAGATLLGEEITLAIELIESGEDVKLGVSINGVLYNNEYFLLTGAASKLGNYVGLYSQNASGYIRIEEEQSGGDNPVEEIPELTKITFANLGIADEMYNSNGNLTAVGKYAGSLLNTSLTHKVTFSNHAGNWLHYAGTEDGGGWYGIRFNTLANGQIQIASANGEFKEDYRIDPTAAGATLLGEEITLTIDLIESGEDVKLGVSINGVLYNNEYFLLEGAASKLGSFVGLYSGDASGYIRIGEEKKPEENNPSEEIPELKEVTLSNMGIANGKYAYADGQLVATGSCEGSLFNTSLTQKVTFSNHPGNWINYAGTPDGWFGIRFNTMADGKIQIAPANGEFPETYYIDPTAAGATLLGKEITLKIDLIQSNQDVKLGVSINGVLYNNEYFLLTGAAEKLGNNIGLYVQEKEGFITIGTQEAAPVLDASFKKLNFASYDIESGSYGYNDNDLAVSGNCGLNSLDKVVFSDTVQFSDANGAQLRIGGKKDAWYGMIWEATGDGKLYVTDPEGGFTPMTFDPEKAGVKLTDNKVKLTLSFEYVDSDEDGSKDDVKLGVWFDGKAYDDRYIYLRDYAGKLGGYLGIYSTNHNSTLTIWTSFPPVDFAEFGFTERWAYTLRLK